MNDLLPAVAHPAVRALGFALAHSLWQALVIAAVAAVFFKKKASADVRYRLGLGSLGAVLASAVATFFFYFEKSGGLLAPAAVLKNLRPEGATAAPTVLSGGVFQPVAAPSFFEKMGGWFEANHPLVVGLWLVGAVFFLVKLFGGWWLADRLKTRHVSLLPADFEEIMADLLKKLPTGVSSRPVRLLESALAAVPMTLGWLRPVVLLPVGLVNRLTIEEVEFVLAHELAHIARRDWLVNLGQALVEALFYFNPAVWWLSARIREEREHRADDLALALTGGHALGYAKALVRVQEAAPAGVFQPALALAFSQKKGSGLLARIQRIVFQQPQSKSASMEKLVATGLVIALAAALSFGAGAPSNPVAQKLAQLASGPVEFFTKNLSGGDGGRDSLPPKKTADRLRGNGFVNTTNDGKSVQLRYSDGRVTDLKVNGTDIAPADFDQYKGVIEECLASVPEPPAPPSLESVPVPPMPAAPPGYPSMPYPPAPPYPAYPASPAYPPYPAFPSARAGFGWAHGGDARPARLEDVTMSGTLNLPDGDEEFSTTDRQGRVHLFLNGKGGKNEIVIDGQSATLNGKPLENGQTVQILKKSDENDFIARTGTGHFFQLKNGELTWNPQDGRIQKQLDEALREAEAEQRLAHVEQLRAMEAQAAAMAREQALHDRSMRWEARAAEKEARAAEKDARAEERENWASERQDRAADLAEREAELALRRAELAAQAAEMDAARSSWSRSARSSGQGASAGAGGGSGGTSYSWSSDGPEVFVQTNIGGDGHDWLRQLLIEDGFDPKNFSVKLDDKSLKINGKKQPAERHERYLDGFRDFGGGRKGGSLQLSFSDDGKGRTSSSSSISNE